MVAGLCLLAGALPAAQAETPLARLMAAVARHADLPPGLVAAVDAGCAQHETHCAARLLADALPGARLVPIVHPDTDRIRRAVTRPSLATVRRCAGGVLLLALDRFGRKADREIADALLSAPHARRLILDLRANEGGDFDRMRRVASLFIGPRDRALRLAGRSGTRWVSLPAPLQVVKTPAIDLLVGPRTASSAEILAALLRRHAGARLIGAATRGKDRLVRVIPVDHDRRLLIPGARVHVPGEPLAGGLAPDIATPSPDAPPPRADASC